MLSLENAKRPPPMSTSKPRRMIGRRDTANVSRAFSTGFRSEYSWSWSTPGGSAGGRRQGVAQEQCPFGGDQFPGLQSLKNLVDPVLLEAYLDRPLHQTLAVGRYPYPPRPVAFADHAVEWNGRRTDGHARTDHEGREHPGPQFMLGVTDFRAHRDPTGIRIDRRPDIDDLSAKQPARIRLHRDIERLSQAEERKVGLGDVRQHPHDRDVGQCVRRRLGARLREEAGGSISRCHPSREGASNN